ncbi:JNK1/MAPK8-associated membrane protein-like [Tropilaelaps mercedesae]|uniref:JNK1/MAPK8-associated membrane protein-like n=1 Tax=Tropilaelaps mercedesae TaxID=418985 RepID=A0A1V9X5S4_9ACAR|nr:JNK1/MAPK8-associated membrane protein-like [Tropilaelaps mercedesae]
MIDTGRMYQTGSLSRYMLSQGVGMISSLHCPGSYCGRIRLGDSGNFSACGACPRGFRVEASVCEECSANPGVYDWLYLGFVVLLGIDVQWWIIDQSRVVLGHRVFTLQLCSLLENVLSALLSLLSFAPWGSLQLTTCPAKRVSDWYTLLHNPSPYYKQTLHCSQEAVYPLYSIVFVYLGYSLVLMLVLRGLLIPHVRWSKESARKTVYLTLYAIPLMALCHAVLAGVLYYSFPYLVMVVSVVSIASHLAGRERQSVTALQQQSLEPRNLLIILSHWLVHAYGLIAATVDEHGFDAFWMLLLAPLPTLFYIYTARFTDPEMLLTY